MDRDDNGQWQEQENLSGLNGEAYFASHPLIPVKREQLAKEYTDAFGTFEADFTDFVTSHDYTKN